MITGPSHAEEIALEKLTYLTFASSPLDLAETMSQKFSNHYINTTTTNDLKGAEYAAVLKNVLHWLRVYIMAWDMAIIFMHFLLPMR